MVLFMLLVFMSLNLKRDYLLEMRISKEKKINLKMSWKMMMRKKKRKLFQ